MWKPTLTALALALPIAAATLAQEPDKKEAPAREPASQVAEVRFGDGSVVRMTLLQESVDVQTRYGKLTVPLAEVRRIDFGLHLPAGTEQHITTSIKLLGSDIYREREDATKDLLQAGHWAYPSLQKAAKSNDMETAQRAGKVIKQICARVSPDLLRLKEDDVIQTNEFPVVGKILNTALKAHSPHFGAVTLKLSDVRALHVRQQCNSAEVVIDATKHGSEPNQWLDSGIVVDPSMRLTVTAEGVVDLWPQTPGQYVSSPKGYNAVGKGGSFMAGALVGKIGEQGKAFLVGERYEGNSGEEGRLYLHIAPSPWNTPSGGSYRVRIHTDPVALTAR